MSRILPGPQNALDAAGTQARQIEGLWWLYFWICAVVFVIVVTVTIVSIARRRARAGHAPALNPEAQERPLIRIVGVAVAVSIVLLLGLVVGDFVTRGHLRSLPGPFMTVRVTGHQWWWEFQYDDPIPSNIVTTATELHVPVGHPVKLLMRSADVIHSFWVPNLMGKKDLFPGRRTELVFRADRPGAYVGQCAEFCGHQHATMRFLVIAESPERFQAWLTAQRAPAAEPSTAGQLRGREVFLSTTCVMCHAVQGTPAGARVGPDLTHVASRQWIASVVLSNTRAHLAEWVTDPQRIRPGVLMPPHPLPPADAGALLDYIQSLR